MSAVSFRSAVATGLVAKPAARDVKARAGLKVYARMTKDRVSLKKDSKWRSDIDIYPVRRAAPPAPSLSVSSLAGAPSVRGTRRRGARARSRGAPRARAPRAPRDRAQKKRATAVGATEWLPDFFLVAPSLRGSRTVECPPAETKKPKTDRKPETPKKKIAESKQEWGEFPMSERTSPLTSLTYDEYKNNVSAEIIHGRFAMLGVTGAWAQENLVGTPWFMAGEECTFDSCSISYLNNKFEASYDGALLGIIFLEIVLMGGAEGYRTGLLENPFDDVTAGSVFPGGRFDPLNFSEGKAANFFGEDLDTLKIKELKHCRLAMLAWLGILAQSVSTNPNGAGPDAVGPVANWSAHVADVVHCNVVDRSGCVF